MTQARTDSLTLPIWFTFNSSALHAFCSIASFFVDAVGK
jgi:hypothetical protein